MITDSRGGKTHLQLHRYYILKKNTSTETPLLLHTQKIPVEGMVIVEGKKGNHIYNTCTTTVVYLLWCSGGRLQIVRKTISMERTIASAL